jgi:phytoene desaturase
MKRAVVIGAGVAGMAAAIRLSKKGFQVSLYEASDHLGGKLSQKQLGQYRFDLGPSLFTLPDLVKELYTLCNEDFDSHFPIHRLDPVAHYFWSDGTFLKASANLDQYAHELSDVLGESPTVVKEYFEKAAWVYNTTRPVFLEASLKRLPWRTKKFWKALLAIPLLPLRGSLHQYNQRRFKNPKTVQLMNRYATYNGSNPYQTPAMMSMIPHLEHGIGAFLPKHGMHQITLSLGYLLEKSGVDVNLSTPVQHIEYGNNKNHGFQKVKGVLVNDKFIQADVVVSNVDAHFTYHKLLPDFPRPEKILKQERSSSAIIFYWGMKKKFPHLDVHNLFLADDYAAEFKGIFQDKQVVDDVTVYVNITSKLVKEDAPQYGENWFVMINAPRYEGKDETEVVAKAKSSILKKLNQILKDDVEQYIEIEEVLTPRLIEERTSSYTGSLYGTSSNSTFAAFMRHDNFIAGLKGLYFVGGSVHPGGGIPLCLQSAKIAAQCIIQDQGQS